MEGVSAILSTAVAHHQAGRLEEAVFEYQKLVAGGIKVPALYHALGGALLALGRAESAVDILRESVALDPRSATGFANMGHALALLSRWQDAAEAYARAFALDGALVEALVEEGVAREQAGDAAAGEACYVRALARRPDDARAWALLARAQHRRRALDDAIGSYRRGVAIRPDAADLWNNLGAALHERGSLDEAEPALRKAIELAPDMAQAHANLGSLLQDRDAREEAKAEFARAIEIDSGNVGARLGACFAELPILYTEAGQIETARARYLAALDRTIAALDLSAPGVADAVAAAVGQQQPFFLPYQAKTDTGPQAKYGAFVCAAMARAHPQWAACATPPAARGGKIRVGFVTAYFRRHSIWKLFRGWIENLDPARFDVIGYWTGGRADEETDAARRACARFVEGRPGYAAMAAAIAADAPHVLIYPEIGMDPLAHKLAALRLAPVQCVSWGHPETTGLPTLDWFLTSDLMEPPGEAERYTERVHRLPGLSIDYAPPAVAPAKMDAADFGLRPSAMRYLCCQSIFKYLPQDDDVLARIAASVPDSQFVFLGHPTARDLTAAFHKRVSAAFAARGLDPARHVVMLPQQDGSRYAALNAACDLFLDSMRWSGGNTTLEALAQGLPALTWPGDQMRGRHSFAILTKAGLEEGIARDADDYVARAVRWGNDRAALAAYRAQTAERRARLWNDRTTTAALGAFLARVAGGAA
ncbi:MAG: tetratricopeptide repeat protein [Alphaproteobacteria bacterium]|nr:tetratricopeptide repeat protein [Alphaproteobacteria bacterium]